MAINNSYDEQAVIKAIASALELFYGSLIEKIDGLDIVKVMKRKKRLLAHVWDPYSLSLMSWLIE